MSKGWVVPAVIGAAFIGWMGVRIAGALKGKEALATEGKQAVEQAVARKNAPATGRSVTPEAATWKAQVTLEGTLKPARESDLAFKVSGRLATVRVKLGDHVRAGESLASLEALEAEAQLKAAEAQVRAAEAQLALADDLQHRNATLLDKGAASQQSGVTSSQQRALAAAQLDGARAQRDLAASTLRNHVLTAPFSGVVTKVPPGPGAIVAPGAVLFHVQDTGTLRLAGTVGESDAALVKLGATVDLSLEGRQVSGKVVAVLSSVDAGTRRVPVEAEIKNDGAQQLLGGAFVRGIVRGGDSVAVLRLPAETLRPGSQDELLLVKDGKLHAVHAQFTLAADGSLLVRKGISAGDQVLFAPSAEAQDGDAVALK